MMIATTEVIVDAEGRTLSAFQCDGAQKGLGPLCRVYSCKDDWICLVVCQRKEWRTLANVEGLEALRADERFRDHRSREKHSEDLTAVLSAWCAQRSVEEALGALKTAGVPCAKVCSTQNVDYFFDDDNLTSERVVEYEHPDTGKLRDVGRTIRFSETPGPELRPFPRFGEHTKEILRELGYREEEIVQLYGDKVVGDKIVA